MLREALYTITFTKPFLNQIRVLTKQEEEGHEIVDYITELSFFKGVEVFGEAIPGTVIQLLAVISRPEQVTTVQMASLVMSVASTGITCMHMTYRKDSDAAHRRNVPWFYGFIPQTGKSKLIIKINLVAVSVAALVARSLSICFLFRLFGLTSVVVLISVEFAMMSFMKWFSGDFYYWMRMKSKIQAFWLSICIRFVVKTLTDFTALPLARHPYELGGHTYIITLIWNQLLCYIVLVRYAQEQSIQGSSNLRSIWVLQAGTSLLFAVNFASMLYLCKPKYRHWFWSKMRVRDYARLVFDEGSDEVRFIQITSTSQVVWENHKEDIACWIRDSWETWRRTKPDFFNAKLISKIPPELLPAAERKLLETTRKNASDSEKILLSSIGEDGKQSSASEKSKFDLKTSLQTRRGSDVIFGGGDGLSNLIAMGMIQGAVDGMGTIRRKKKKNQIVATAK
jgi:hypothetical protein